MPLPPDRATAPDQQDQARQDSFFLYMTLAVFLGLLITVNALYLLNALGLGAYFPVNADSWLRLLRVRALMEGAAWHTTPLVETIDPPYGLISPWTRIGDLPLWGLASALGALAAIPVETALTTAATLWNLAITVSAIFTLLWATRILDFSPSTRAIMVSLLFVSPVWVLVFEFGSADYHGMSVVIFLACLGSLWRIQKAPTQKQAALILGLLITLGVWISVDFMVPGLLIICALGLGWANRAHGIRPLIVTTLTTAILLIPCLFIEQSLQTVFKTEYDTLSIIYISMWGGVAGIALVLGALSQYLRSSEARLGTSFLVASGVLWLLLAQFPESLMGPMASVQSRNYYNYEITPFGALKNNDFIPIVIFICCVIYGSTKIYQRKPLKTAHKTTLFISIVISLLFFYQIRWGFYYPIFIVLFGFYMEKIRKESENRFLRQAVNALAFSIPLLTTVLFFLNRNTPDWANMISSAPRWGQEDAIVLTHLDLATALAFRTHLRPLTSNFHRSPNYDRVADLHRTADANLLLEKLSKNNIRYIYFLRNHPEFATIQPLLAELARKSYIAERKTDSEAILLYEVQVPSSRRHPPGT